MAEIRRGTAMLLLTAGDEEISKALASGIMTARLPAAKPLAPEQMRVVKAELDIQKAADLLRVAMHPEPVDYAGKCFEAEAQYGESLYEPGPLKRAAEALLVGWALLVMGLERLFERVESGE